MMMEEAHSGESEFSLIDITRMVFRALVDEFGVTEDDDVFYTYGYDVRWSLQQLRNEGLTSFVKREGKNFHYLASN